MKTMTLEQKAWEVHEHYPYGHVLSNAVSWECSVIEAVEKMWVQLQKERTHPFGMCGDISCTCQGRLQ